MIYWKFEIFYFTFDIYYLNGELPNIPTSPALPAGRQYSRITMYYPEELKL